MENFKPDNEEEKQFVSHYNGISKAISKQIRALDEEKRLPYLREAEPTDPSLMNLYLQALQNEDYETCAVAKALLLERGIQVPK
ncbi:hypothetical protein [Sabulibacter ruber]|uniref:hypothetical protein n=1 Tax=Sabulibacter ruber TaxID=2811901 RepID=UPI001A956665|nr:hypothetical protein [Sabulibacter ruber]